MRWCNMAIDDALTNGHPRLVATGTKGSGRRDVSHLLDARWSLRCASIICRIRMILLRGMSALET